MTVSRNVSDFITLLLLVSLYMKTIKSTTIPCIATEREALFALKKGLADPSGRLSSWTGNDCCRWNGISCHNTSGHITELDLSNPFPYTSFGIAALAQGDTTAYKRSCLGGEISSSLLGLPYLDYLDLSLNDFEGIPIPSFIGSLQKLRYLNLSFASFAGQIPTQLGNLSNLNYLDLYAESYIDSFTYQLTSMDLRWLSHLSSLSYLNMGQVNLNSVGKDWLQTLNMLPSLVELRLYSCSLQSLPASLPFVNFTSLSILDLSMNSINSSIPNWLVNLTSLTTLDLSGNSFSGVIPSDIGDLVHLEALVLASNGQIEGQVPKTLGHLCKLQILDLSGNNLTGGIDELLTGFSVCFNKSLVSLDLGGNQLAGELPDSLGVLKNLQQLKLTGNSFWGSIPTSIGNMSSLQGLDLSFNKMNGTIPESFGNLSELVELYLQANPWEGVITEAHLMNLTRLQNVILIADTNMSLVLDVAYEWVPPFRLKSLDLENCLVGPRFPRWLQVQSELTDVILKNVGIEDTIPEEWFSNISDQLTYLDLSNNQIMGKLPSQLKSPHINAIDLSYNRFEGPLPLWSTNTPHFYLQNNLFSGPIPPNIDELMPQLQYLFFSENRLNGTIPSSICKMTNLQVLSLRTNQLFGEFPKCWNKSQPLWVVDLANNNLTGTIPSSLSNLQSLSILMLSNNKLQGEIPQSLQNCSGLMSLDLGGNRLSGRLPPWIGENVSNFWMIRLRSNSFSGTVPWAWCNLPILHILDLADNNVSGEIPSCIGNLTALVYDNSSTVSDDFFRIHQYYYEEQTTVVTKGTELEYGRTLEFVNIIDLSGNNLVGEIPQNITSLTALGTLNLSRNHLTGTIPDKIAGFRWLETLDLSHNNLSGPIPPGISSLTSLAHLNLSDNNFSGRIPTGNQLQTLVDPSIYEGNPLLCGLPLPTKCPGDADTPNSSSSGVGLEGNEDEKDDEKLWFYVSMGSGFVVGLSGVCCTLAIKDSWRKKYFRFFRIA